MTGFASLDGGDGRAAWRWELRSVNGRGLDIRWKGPEGRDAVEKAFRASAAARFGRGSVSISLKVSRDAGQPAMRINRDALAALLAAAAEAADAVRAAGLAVGPVSPDALILRAGVLEPAEDEAGPEARAAQDALMLADGEAALDALAAAREAEGAALHDILRAQVDRIADLTETAEIAAEARAEAAGPALTRKIAALVAAGAPAELSPDRLAQELALLAVKGDVREELDRLRAHVTAARKLLAAAGPVGRKLDFLVQEFNREANTLCSKADFTALTEAGLELKTVIDQLREQAQNIE